MLVHLVQMKLAPKFQSVRTNHFRNRVAQVQRVVDLSFVGDRNAHYEPRKGNIFDALKLGRLHHHAGWRWRKTLRPRADAQTAFRLADDIGIVEKPSVKFVDRTVVEGLSVSPADELGPSEWECVETGDARSALLAWIRIVEAVIIEEVVPGKLAHSAIRVDSPGSLIIAHGL